MPSETSVRVFVLSDDDTRATVDAVLEAARDIEVVGYSSSLEIAESEIRRANANVAIIDVRHHEDGIVLCREIRARMPDVTCLVVSNFSGDEAKVDAILCGADDALDIDDALPDRLRSSREQPSRVRRFLDDARGRELEGDEDPMAKLTYRERGVVRHIVEGRTNREIGDQLGLAEKTVRNYVSNILNKLNLENRTQLAVHLARSLDRVD